MEILDNRALMPAYLPDDQVELEGISPDWVKNLIIAEVRIKTATAEGTFAAAVKVLDHYAEMGVNALWLTPPYADRATYSVKHPDKLSSLITGCDDAQEGFAAAKGFVDEAHRRNIRIFFDIVTWGTSKDSPLVTAHPDWYDNWREAYGGYVWKWSNTEWQEWFTANAVEIVLKTGIDGYRCDLEPDNTGYDLFREVRRRLLEKGRKIAIFSEVVNRRLDTYDFEEVGVGSDENSEHHYNSFANYFLEKQPIVDCVKTGHGIGHKDLQAEGKGGEFRFYTNCVTCHDSRGSNVGLHPLTIGYAAILAPFIPLWFIGEEWGNPVDLTREGDGAMFFNVIDWSAMEKPENRAFFEKVKRYIRIRRERPAMFTCFPENHRRINICEVKTDVQDGLQAYARFMDGRAVVVLPNNGEEARTISASLPLEEMGLSSGRPYRVVDLMTGEDAGELDEKGGFSAAILPGDFGVFEIID